LAWLVATTVKVKGLGVEGTVKGALYSPEVVIVPQLELPVSEHVIDHVTDVSAVPVTVPTNCCDPPIATEALVGLIEIATGGGCNDTVAEAFSLGSAWLAAITVTGNGSDPLENVPGALYRPELVIVPHLEFGVSEHVTDQVTDVSEFPLTVAPNCCDWPIATEVLVGLIVIVIGASCTDMVAEAWRL
jgi:hypothetical protein